jgi:glycine betaine catabolism A
MIDLTRIRSLFDARKPGYSLPQALYNDADVFEFDLEAIWRRSWLLAATEADLPRDGSYLATNVAATPVVILRDRDGVVRAFHNSCRHRGGQICGEGKGKSNRLVCPYHKWTYELTGELVSATRMDEGFDPADFPLVPIACEVLEGVIYLCLSENAPDFAPFREAFAPLLAPHQLSKAKLAYECSVMEKGNWKLVMENARECYHCATGHPELSRSFPVASRAYFDYGEDPRVVEFNGRMEALQLPVGPVEGDWWQAIRFPLNEGFQSMSMDGAPYVKTPMTTSKNFDIGSLRWALEPNTFCHAVGDYAVIFICEPVGPQDTKVTVKWLVHADAVEGVDYDPKELSQLWDMTNLQDRDLVELNQRGVNSAGYRPGPYSSEAEVLVLRLVDWYCATATDYLDGGRKKKKPALKAVR